MPEITQAQLDILNRYKRAGIIESIPDLTGAYDGSFPVQP